MVEVIQTLQSSIDGQFTRINSTLGEISERLSVLESKQQSIEEKIETGYSSINSTPQSSCSESGTKRRRRTPVSLQVKICILYEQVTSSYIYYVSLQHKIHIIHNALDEDNQFRVHEP